MRLVSRLIFRASVLSVAPVVAFYVARGAEAVHGLPRLAAAVFGVAVAALTVLLMAEDAARRAREFGAAEDSVSEETER